MEFWCTRDSENSSGEAVPRPTDITISVEDKWKQKNTQAH